MKTIALTLSLAVSLVVGLSSCISKKKVDLMESDYLDQLTELRNEKLFLSNTVARMKSDSIYLKGGNDALLATQENFLERLDQLEEELDNMNLRATSTAEGKDLMIQQKEREIDRLNGLLGQIEELLQKRLDRLSQVATACEVALQPYDSLLWSVDYMNTACVIRFNENLLFTRGSTTRFVPVGESSIGDVAAIVRQFPDLVINVVGHTDNQAPPRRGVDKWDYSLLRASSVAKLLIQKFDLSTTQVLPAGKGEFSPMVSNETTEGRAQNRRVELILQFQESDLVRDLNRVLVRGR